MRLPVSREDRNARIGVLESRVSSGLPHVGDDGTLHHRGSSTHLSEIQGHLMRVLIRRFGAISESRRSSPRRGRKETTAGNLRVMVTELRPVLVPLDLQIRGPLRGYLLTTSDRRPDRR